MKALPLIALLLIFSGCEETSPAGATNNPPAGNTRDVDNTANNKRDQSEVAKTAIDQNENQADIDITANIRKRVVDTQMSINAQNVKIITQDGKVTLRGPVKSADEKKQIQEMAVAVAGEGNVDNQLEVEAE